MAGCGGFTMMLSRAVGVAANREAELKRSFAM